MNVNKRPYKVAIIIPIYNEIKNIKKVLASLNNKYNLIIVDDGSNDRTNFDSFKQKHICIKT